MLSLRPLRQATHHGPWLETPALFAEIGSAPDDWERADASRFWAEVPRPPLCFTLCAVQLALYALRFTILSQVLWEELALGGVADADADAGDASPRTKWTRRVPHPALIGHEGAGGGAAAGG